MTDDMPFAGDPDPFEYWVQQGLRTRFNDVVREPVPESLLRIMNACEPPDRAHALRRPQAEAELVSGCLACRVTRRP